MCLALRASGLWLRYATLQNWFPSFPWIAPPRHPPWRNPRKGRDQILPSGNLANPADAAAGAADANDDGQWNPMEWDRAAEELTWERLLGLDGSLVFLEHVFWVVSLNTLFVLVFAFCPYHIGHFTIAGLKLKEQGRNSQENWVLLANVGMNKV